MLYIIAVPIGHIEDISFRAKKLLSEVDVLLCEDTRKTNQLLDLLQITKKPKMESFYDEVEDQKIPKITEWLLGGKNIALVSDAGTPVISDPGWKLIKKCQQLGLKYTALPGPCALINAIVLSGLPSGRFSFLGFLPKKSGERIKILKHYKEIDGLKIVYESPFRVKKLVEEIKTVYGENAEIKICREMTKKFEEVSNIVTSEKGEMVVVFI
jgi:16S rRNA (cytidine1402-2'-O)-methyltransferase